MRHKHKTWYDGNKKTTEKERGIEKTRKQTKPPIEEWTI